MRILISLIFFSTLFSCVPRKKLIYLQDRTDNIEQTFSSKKEEYRLKPADVVAVNIFSLTPGEFDIFSTSNSDVQNPTNLFTIDSEGRLELPAVGHVDVKNLTIKEAQDKIRILLEDYLRSPLVRITLQTPFEFTVLGEVNNPGRFTLIGEEITLLEALGTAGDLSRFADRSEIKVIRKTKNGETEIAYVNVLKEDLLASEYYYLKSEDVIIVDPLRARSTRENQLYFFTSLVGVVSSLTLVLMNITRLQ